MVSFEMSMIMSEKKYYAHIDENGRKQTVKEHLEGTAELCAKFAGAFGAEEQGRYIGLAHDIGKYSEEFQKRLLGGHIVDHSTAGALECANQNAYWAACCVAGHHGGLPDVGNPRNDTQDYPTLSGRLDKARKGKIPSYRMPDQLPAVGNPPGYGRGLLGDSFMIRMLYSCLVDADYLDTERFMAGDDQRQILGEALPCLLNKLNQYVEKRGFLKPGNDLNGHRCDVLKACMNGAGFKKGLFTLTVPTGGGKTIASMAFALTHAVRHGMDRVIYVIPFTSIIEQTAEVFRGIFGENNVIEHHSNTSLEIEEDSDKYRLTKAVENWDAPIIVTTAVQFFESIYSNRPSKCRKLHSIANSVLVFDEAQMLPAEHLRPCVAAIASTVVQFGSSVMLCTATQPVLNDIFKEYAPNLSITEICPRPDILFEQLRRVSFDNVGKISLDMLSKKLSDLSQVLCIVNSRKAAQDIYEMLPREGSYHLSTLMIPFHRKSILSEIRERLAGGLVCRVVSTSLIEAGVDVDFPAVYREIAGMDSILQAAGRCNREGKNKPEESIVTIFEGISVTPQMLQVNISSTSRILKDGGNPGDLGTVEQYFSFYRMFAGQKLDKREVVSSFEKGIAGNYLPFRTVSERFHLIDDASKTIYIPYGKGEELVNCLRYGERSRSLFRRLGLYSVSVYENQFRMLLDHGNLEPVDEDSAILADNELYSDKTGLKLKSDQLEFLNI